jgi:predicted transcriptional regulator of viral defense system
VQKITFMKTENKQISVENWIDRQISFGKLTFSIDRLENELPEHSQTAIKRSLSRLTKKEKVVSVHKGFYAIVSPEYSSWKILPPALFIDGLMKYLNRPYYTGLLNAAAFYGASHQSPQEFFVFTNFPVMRPTRKKGIKVNYISKAEIPGNFLEDKKTETGYLKVSSPELTAADIVQYQKRIGGLNRAATILEELAESINIEKINRKFLSKLQTSVIQRLGFLLEEVIEDQELSEKIFVLSQKMNLKFFPVPLGSAKEKRGFSSNNRWRVIVNTEFDIDQ